LRYYYDDEKESGLRNSEEPISRECIDCDAGCGTEEKHGEAEKWTMHALERVVVKAYHTLGSLSSCHKSKCAKRRLLENLEFEENIPEYLQQCSKHTATNNRSNRTTVTPKTVP